VVRSKKAIRHVRILPVQTRSRERLEAILDAGSMVFASTGFDGATMEAIALRGKMSIGSLYRFFPNKAALFAAIADRNFERARLLYNLLLTPAALARPWPEIIDAVIDGFQVLKRTDPGFRATAMNLQLYGRREQGDRALHAELIERTEIVIAQKAPHVPVARQRLLAAMINHVIAGMLFFADREDTETANAIIAETKVLLRRYLGPEMETKRVRTRVKSRPSTR
jgi:AcrR family transcriptional regulator